MRVAGAFTINEDNMSQDISEEVIQDINVLLGKDILICPICSLPLHRYDPDDVYKCPACGAWFEMLSYGTKN